MRVVAVVLLVRMSIYGSLGLVFGLLAFTRSNAYRRRTGNSPWHIHPLVWGGMSVFVAWLVTLASLVFVAIFGTVLSIATWSPRLAGRLREAHRNRPEDDPAPAGHASPLLSAWLSDPSGRNELRYFDGRDWTGHVANGGVISSDDL